jgi:hypothetical protein
MIVIVRPTGDTSGCYHRPERRSEVLFEGEKYYWCLDCLKLVKVPKNIQGIYLY